VQNLLNIALLLSAILTCLAIGVASSYGLCNLLFAAMKLRSSGSVPASVGAKVVDAARL
jgi:hypothetical protein